MKYELTATEARVIGCLLEKAGDNAGTVSAFRQRGGDSL